MHAHGQTRSHNLAATILASIPSPNPDHSLSLSFSLLHLSARFFFMENPRRLSVTNESLWAFCWFLRSNRKNLLTYRSDCLSSAYRHAPRAARTSSWNEIPPSVGWWNPEILVFFLEIISHPIISKLSGNELSFIDVQIRDFNLLNSVPWSTRSLSSDISDLVPLLKSKFSCLLYHFKT